MLLNLLLLSGVTITLQPEARVRGAEIQVAAVATVEGDDASEVALVRNLSLGYSPAPGYSRLIDAEKVADDLARQLPKVAVRVRGANACRAWPQSERVAGSTIEAAARAELARLFDGCDAQVRLTAPIADIDIPSGERDHALRAVLAETDLHGGPANVPVRVLVDGVPYRTIWTNWDVDLWEQCSVPKVAIRAGETITEDMLETRRVTSRGPRAAQAMPATLVVGASAARELPAGQPIAEMSLIRPTLVQRGETVFLEIRRGAISARVGATAQQAGKKGERIRFALLDGKRELEAVVVSRDLAVIDMSSSGGLR